MLAWFKTFFGNNSTTFDPMKYLIVGLGNMGSEYDNTRHNIGFDVVDYLAKDGDAKWKNDTLGDLAEVKHKGRTLILLKPSTYMNLSGKAVRYWMEKHKVTIDTTLIILDDLHLDLGLMRLRDKGSDGGHNGLKDIQEKLGSQVYYRLRLGIGQDFHAGQQVNFVLGKWKNHERENVDIMIEKAAKAVKNFATIGYKLTTENLNR
jgi:peptidyl-tRNA hydrolase, PTH1 family